MRRGISRNRSDILFHFSVFPLKIIEKEVALYMIGEAKKKRGTTPFWGRGVKRGCPKQDLDMRRG